MTENSEVLILKKLLEDHILDSNKRWAHYDNLQEKNMEATANLITNVADLTKATEGIVQLSTDIQGTLRIGAILQKFIIFIMKWGIVGTILSAMVAFINKQVAA